MFKFLKEKLKKAVEVFSKKAEEEAEEFPAEKKVSEKGKIKEKVTKKPAEKWKKPEAKEKREKAEEKVKIREEKIEEEAYKEKEVAEKKEKEEVKEEVKEEKERKEEEKIEKKGFLARIVGIKEAMKEAVTTKVLSESKFEELFNELEIALLENNVAYEVVQKIKEDMKKNLVGKRIERGKFEDIVGKTLYSSIESLFDVEKINIIKAARQKRPYIIVFFGVNGSGKTTTIAKMARLLQNNGLKPVIAAADTFRAAAIQQLEIHGEKLGVKVIKHDYGADPAAVAFDAIKYAEAKKMDVVLIDTAGRQHSNVNLMDEMRKIVRVAKPDLKIFIGESITGNDCIEQAKEFNEAAGIDAIVLTKADVDEKGGAAVSVSYVTGKPIIYIGTGQGYDDLKEFSKELIMKNIGIA
ncbi:MAG: signal recognition particle-docking protein FtsY [Candidatus Woesearchaeota archaeon]|nr:signal recognition particle-docking protein FtsY [Candidatus Woesearchaeota archaeon]